MGQKRNPFNILINQKLQIRFAVFVASLVGGSLVLVWFSIEILMYILADHFKADPVLGEFVKEVHYYVIYFFIWEGLVALVVSILLTLMLSRRVVGPIFRIQEELEYFLEHNKLKSQELRLRKKDAFKDFAGLIVKVLGELKKQKKK